MRKAFVIAAAGLVLASAAQAQDVRQGDLTISNAWARPTAGPNKLGAAYLTVKNSGGQGDTLTSVSSPDANQVQIHENTIDAHGVMKMRAVQGGLKIAPGATVQLKPGGYHIMLMGLKENLKEGQTVPLKLTFAHAGTVDVPAKVEKKPSQQTSAMTGMHH